GFGELSDGLSDAPRSPERQSACSSNAAERTPGGLARSSAPCRCEIGPAKICSNRAIAASARPRRQPGPSSLLCPGLEMTHLQAWMVTARRAEKPAFIAGK